MSQTVHPISHWVGFTVFLAAALALDIGLVQRKAHEPGTREALGWTAIWILVAAAVGGAIYMEHGTEPFLQYLTGYLVEKSLSADNLFVFLVLFSAFEVPKEQRRRVLSWGIFGALALRGLFIWAGAALLERFHWLMFVFGALLLISALRMLRHAESGSGAGNLVIGLLRKSPRSTVDYHGGHFFVRSADGRLLFTPLFAALIAIEATDIVFAVDSIPAILGVASDPFIVFTSNAMAVLGLRALFFAMASALERLRYLKAALIAILSFVGIKMLIHDYAHFPALASLAVIAAILVVAVVFSLRASRDPSRHADAASRRP